MSIHEIAAQQKTVLAENGIRLVDELEDLDRPWGGYLVIDPQNTQQFIDTYFTESDFNFDTNQNLQPKILMVLSDQRLSWQYHHRRAEYWRAVDSQVGYHKSHDDDQGEVQTLSAGEFVRFDTQERHRLVGLGAIGIVAEIWEHTDPTQPSDEADIVRISDDYSRI